MVVQTTSRGEPKVNTNIHFFKKSFKNEQTYFKFETFWNQNMLPKYAT